jgi:hypothetical protein
VDELCSGDCLPGTGSVNLTFRSLVACATLALLVAGFEDLNSGSAEVIAELPPGTSSAPATEQWLSEKSNFLSVPAGEGNCLD